MSDITDDQRRAEFTAALNHLDAVVAGVPDTSWTAPSPCEGWTAVQVLAHVTGTVGKALAVLTGGDSYGGTPAAGDDTAPDEVLPRWAMARDAAREALGAADLTRTLETPRGTESLGTALGFPTSDIACHAWDIAAATDQPREFPDTLTAQVRRQVGSLPEERLRVPGLFGPEQPAPADASESDRIMAWLGRVVP